MRLIGRAPYQWYMHQVKKSTSNHADIRQQMWTMGVLGYHSPQALLNAVHFIMAKIIA